MKNEMKRLGKIIALMLLVVAAAVAAVGCGVRYTSHYSATVLIQSNKSDSAWVSFSSLKGTIVYKLKVRYEDEFLRYYGKLGEGSITVYYDNEGTKEEWFSLQGGENVEGKLEKPGKGKVYIIVETDGKCKDGKLDFIVEGATSADE